ncbi:MAG: hypothetical protein EHM45_03225 [Desulfobacteraceae bacterium]|nr:MAG: hypothetical protein EHM45_03225 [Desulfobacteraceae bacterium]
MKKNRYRVKFILILSLLFSIQCSRDDQSALINYQSDSGKIDQLRNAVGKVSDKSDIQQFASVNAIFQYQNSLDWSLLDFQWVHAGYIPGERSGNIVYPLETIDPLTYDIFIDSPEAISFQNLDIKRKVYYKKKEAELVIAKYMSKMKPNARITLAKHFYISEKGLENEIDEIQEWLVSQGFKNITFIIASSFKGSDIVRQYWNDKIIR